MQTFLILLGTAIAVAVILGIRAYNRAVERELAPRTSAPDRDDSPGDDAGAPATNLPSFTDLSSQAAQDFLVEHPNAILLDVRTPGECASGIIEGAMQLPMQELQGREDEIPEGPLLVYCAVGARSAAVADYLARRGRKEVYNIEGGFMEWTGKRVHP